MDDPAVASGEAEEPNAVPIPPDFNSNHSGFGGGDGTVVVAPFDVLTGFHPSLGLDGEVAPHNELEGGEAARGGVVEMGGVDAAILGGGPSN
jgi:hypothetical protein